MEGSSDTLVTADDVVIMDVYPYPLDPSERRGSEVRKRKSSSCNINIGSIQHIRIAAPVAATQLQQGSSRI
ncbi:hypothetical protein ACLKA6_000600 [Drosophila palustris]